MIYTERIITANRNTSKINSPIILYRGDKNIGLKLKIVNNIFQDATHAQLILKNQNKIITIDIARLQNDVLEINLPAGFMDEVTEVGMYTIQIRLFNEDQTSVATLPEIIQALEIREPIAIQE